MTHGYSIRPGTQGPLEEIPQEGLRKIWRWAWVIALGGFLFGYDTGVISGALLFVKGDFHLTALQQGSVVSVLLIGATAGALGIGSVSDRIGRRRVLGIEGAVFVLGTVIAASATGYPMLLSARLLLGLAVGSASATVPIYLSEISPPEIRGRVLTLNQMLITIGILLAYLIDLAFSSSSDWRAMFAIGAVPALGMVAGALWVLPESPQWLLLHGRLDELRRLVASVSDQDFADRTVKRWQQSRSQAAARTGVKSQRTGWRVLLAPSVRPALIVGLSLAVLQQFTGINTIVYYAPTIMEETGLNSSNSIVYSVYIGAINVAVTIVAIRLVDRIGRRPLLLVSLAGMCITLLLLGASFVNHWPSGLTLVFMLLYIVSFGIGLGPVFWVLVGEIFPVNARAAGSGASTAVNWISNFIVSLVFLSIVDAIGQGQTFWIFALISALALVFTGRYVPETKDREYNQVDADLQTRFGRQRPPVGTVEREGMGSHPDTA
jgi:sugar porter (SP) family MFS transporter